MLMVGVSESLEKILFTQELQCNKTKQINPWSIGTRGTNHHSVSMAKTTGIQLFTVFLTCHRNVRLYFTQNLHEEKKMLF